MKNKWLNRIIGLSGYCLWCLIVLLAGYVGNAQQEIGNSVVTKVAPYFGIYENQDKDGGLMIGMLENYPVIFFPDGKIKGIFDTLGELVIGNSIGRKDAIEGYLRFEKNKKSAQAVIKNSDGQIWTGGKVELLEKEVSFKSQKNDFIERDKDAKKDIKLSGTLILPNGKGPFPAIVFAHGSGQETRDASRGLAALFAYNGFACLIFDKRGVGKSEGNHWAASFSDYANDLLNAVQLLRKIPEVKKEEIGLYGHSQGGWVVPLAIDKDPGSIAFAILSAANGVSPIDQHTYNGRRILGLRKIDSNTISEVETFRRNKYAASLGRITKEKFYEEILPAAKKQDWLTKSKLTNEELGVDQFFEYNCYYDPLPALSKVKCPVLLIYGEQDNYTDSKLNAALIQEQLKSNGNKNVTCKIFPNANHAMLYTTTGYLYNREMPFLDRFVEGYLDLLVSWLKKM